LEYIVTVLASVINSGSMPIYELDIPDIG